MYLKIYIETYMASKFKLRTLLGKREREREGEKGRDMCAKRLRDKFLL